METGKQKLKMETGNWKWKLEMETKTSPITGAMFSS